MIEPMVDRTKLCVRFERVLSVAPQRVFDAWTKPEQLSLWWNPEGTPLRSCEIDLRVGGAFCFQGHHSGPAFAGVYRLVEPPHRLVFDALGALGTVEIEAHGTGSLMRVRIEGASAEHFEQLLHAGVHDGTARTLMNLERFLCDGATR